MIWRESSQRRVVGMRRCYEDESTMQRWRRVQDASSTTAARNGARPLFQDHQTTQKQPSGAENAVNLVRPNTPYHPGFQHPSKPLLLRAHDNSATRGSWARTDSDEKAKGARCATLHVNTRWPNLEQDAFAVWTT